MARVQVGERVGVILDSDVDQVRLLGYGVFDGDQPCPHGPFGMTAAELEEMKKSGLVPADFVYMNPRITLDNGDHAWGNQTWWGREAAVKEYIGNRKVINVRIVDGEAVEVA